MDHARPPKSTFAAFLLTQVGAHAARKYAERLAPLNLIPPHAGILRLLVQSTGLSQRELAAQLGMHASRLVAVVDEMESLGLVKRESNAEDRRSYSLQITPKGKESLAQIRNISAQHNDDLCAALNPDERAMLVTLLQRIADQQGLIHNVHPGYSRLGQDPNTPAHEPKPEETDTIRS